MFTPRHLIVKGALIQWVIECAPEIWDLGLRSKSRPLAAGQKIQMEFKKPIVVWWVVKLSHTSKQVPDALRMWSCDSAIQSWHAIQYTPVEVQDIEVRHYLPNCQALAYMAPWQRWFMSHLHLISVCVCVCVLPVICSCIFFWHNQGWCLRGKLRRRRGWCQAFRPLQP